MRAANLTQFPMFLTLLVVMGTTCVIAQRPVDGTVAVPRLDLSTGYEYIDANAPPGGCKCFALNGGFVDAGLHFNQWLALEAQVTGSHASNISLLGQNLNLITYMGGPRVTYKLARLGIFGDGLVGAAHGSDSYFPTGTTYTSSASSFAWSGGGGVDYELTPRFAVRLIQAQYLRTMLPNGTTNAQNHLMLGAGIVIKFRGRDSEAKAVVSKAPDEVTSLACTGNRQNLSEGQVLDVTGRATTVTRTDNVVYTWASNAGTIQGSGRQVSVNTADVADGDYVVYGHAALADGSWSSADCEVNFHVKARPQPVIVTAAIQPVTPVPPPIPAPVHDDAEFHTNVPDILFDYDKWAIRPDSDTAIQRAAEYLAVHPNVRIMIGGYSDERGTMEYNIALGLKRANAVRDALLAQGVTENRMRVVSYGKGAQVCMEENESCWQQNRRAAFMVQP